MKMSLIHIPASLNAYQLLSRLNVDNGRVRESVFVNQTSRALFMSALFLLGGCANPLAPPDRASRVLRPSLEPMPYAMAIHYPAHFRNATELAPQMSGFVRFMRKATMTEPSNWNYPYGSNSVVLLDAAFASMFDKVIQLEHRPNGLLGSSEVRGTLVPETVVIELLFEPRLGWSVKARYKVSLYSFSGALATSWEVSSHERRATDDRLGVTIHAAMTEAVARLVSTILDEKPKFKEWLAPGASR